MRPILALLFNSLTLVERVNAVRQAVIEGEAAAKASGGGGETPLVGLGDAREYYEYIIRPALDADLLEYEEAETADTLKNDPRLTAFGRGWDKVAKDL